MSTSQVQRDEMSDRGCTRVSDLALTDSVRTEYHKHVQIVPWVYEGKLCVPHLQGYQLTE